MDQRVLRRFVKNMAVLVLVVFSLWALWEMYSGELPGDYATRQGDIRLSEGNLEEAMASFERALRENPGHRGALMGRALVFIQKRAYDAAEAQLTALIERLATHTAPDDATGTALLRRPTRTAASSTTGAGATSAALADYVRALRIDAGAVKGPGIIDKVIYGTPDPATVRGRAIYLEKQLALPPEKRLLRVPALDAAQRMHKP